jgi:hypothetical protein
VRTLFLHVFVLPMSLSLHGSMVDNIPRENLGAERC